MAKAAGNGYSPSPKATAPRLYSTKSGRWRDSRIQLDIRIQPAHVTYGNFKPGALREAAHL
jgi:hypothetical protein